MKEIDIINSMFEDNTEKKGILKQELDYFNSMSKEIDNFNEKTTISKSADLVKLDVINNDFESYKTKVIKLAAQTSESKTQLKPKFYISDDDKFAIKIVLRNNEYHCSIITNEITFLEDILVYCEELDDYFAANSEGKFMLLNISGIDLNKLSFSFILPVFSLNLYNIQGNFHLISDFKADEYSMLEEEHSIKIDFPAYLRYTKVALKNENVKNVISKKDKGITINRKLLSDKNILLFY